MTRRFVVISLFERKLYMLKKQIIGQDFLRLMGYDSEDILPSGGLVAVLARAGVGKTAFLVQLAMNRMLQDRSVLHVSLTEPVEKVCLWYEEVMRNLATRYQIHKLDPLWETVLPKRFIMTFRADVFTATRLEERISDLTEQGIFYPQMILVDGLNFEETQRKAVEDLRAIAQDLKVPIWFSVRTHRREIQDSIDIPKPIAPVQDLFEFVFELHPLNKEVQVRALKGAPAQTSSRPLILDPSSMMVREMPVNIHQDNTRQR
jgi:hypothetical protein